MAEMYKNVDQFIKEVEDIHRTTGIRPSTCSINYQQLHRLMAELVNQGRLTHVDLDGYKEGEYVLYGVKLIPLETWKFDT